MLRGLKTPRSWLRPPSGHDGGHLGKEELGGINSTNVPGEGNKTEVDIDHILSGV